MKPYRNRVFCPSAQRQKMVFETKEKADKFISYNAAQISESSSMVPTRSYYCMACGGWHVTHLSFSERLKYMDRQQEAVEILSELTDGLKNRFDISEWEKWSVQIEKAVPYLEITATIPDLYLFHKETERQISHYQSLIRRQKRKATACEYSDDVERIHQLHQNIFHLLSSKRFEECLSLGPEFKKLLSTPSFEALSERKRRNYLLLADCLTDKDKTEVYGVVFHLLCKMDESILSGEPVSLSDFQNLENVVDSLSDTDTCNEILSPIRNGLEKVRRRCGFS